MRDVRMPVALLLLVLAVAGGALQAGCSRQLPEPPAVEGPALLFFYTDP